MSSVLVGGEGEDASSRSRLAQLQLEVENTTLKLEDQREYYEERLRAQGTRRSEPGRDLNKPIDFGATVTPEKKLSIDLGTTMEHLSVTKGVCDSEVGSGNADSELIALHVELSYANRRLQDLLLAQEGSVSSSMREGKGVYMSKNEQDELRRYILRILRLRVSLPSASAELLGIVRALRFCPALGFCSAEPLKEFIGALHCCPQEQHAANSASSGRVAVLSRSSERELQAIHEAHRLRLALRRERSQSDQIKKLVLSFADQPNESTLGALAVVCQFSDLVHARCRINLAKASAQTQVRSVALARGGN